MFFFVEFLESQIPSVHLMFAFPIPYWGPQSWSSTRWIAWSPAASLAQNLNWMEGMEGSEHALDKLHDCVTEFFFVRLCQNRSHFFGQGGSWQSWHGISSSKLTMFRFNSDMVITTISTHGQQQTKWRCPVASGGSACCCGLAEKERTWTLNTDIRFW